MLKDRFYEKSIQDRLLESSVPTPSCAIRIISDNENSRSEIAFLVSILYNIIDSDNSLSNVGLSTKIFFGGFKPTSLNAFAKLKSASVKTFLAILSDNIPLIALY